MKYIYCILGILILITLGLGIRLSDVKVDVSEPALVVNDRILSKSELDEFAKVGSYHSLGEGFLDSVITRELLIQEAVKQGIHKEETFRKSVEDFYEQSLVKALVDRKFQTLVPKITADMIARYREMSPKTIRYTKYVYETEEALQKGEALSVDPQENDFENLSDTLKYAFFMLTPGDSASPTLSDEGVVVFRLDAVLDSPNADAVPDDGQVRSLLTDQAKKVMFDAWLRDIRKDARIQIVSDEDVDTGESH